MRGLIVVVQDHLQRATRLCIRCSPERALPMSLRGSDNPANEERESSHALLDSVAAYRSLVEQGYALMRVFYRTLGRRQVC
jgi:hypothetical protein